MGKTWENPKSYDLRNQKWIRESVTRGEGISTPQRPFIKTVPLINCAKYVSFQNNCLNPKINNKKEKDKRIIYKVRPAEFVKTRACVCPQVQWGNQSLVVRPTELTRYFVIFVPDRLKVRSYVISV